MPEEYMTQSDETASSARELAIAEDTRLSYVESVGERLRELEPFQPDGPGSLYQHLEHCNH
ncbi:hypothetical protein KY362_01295 [Candidatus Woesearchaeota archaeon]|nr:hypothetical protein [Candidatus Woesearchaeota archaeon]